MAVSKGVYSLYNGWLEKPEKGEIPEMPDITAKYNEYKNRAEACNTVEEIDNFLDDLYRLRQNSLLSDGEFGEDNLLFKELRNNNVLQDLKDKKVELENNEMSLKEEYIEEASEEDNRAKALANYLDLSVEAIEDEGEFLYDSPEGEYVVLSEDEAYDSAADEIRALLDDIGLDAFTDGFKDYVLNNCINYSPVEDFIEEEVDYYGVEEEDPEMVSYLNNMDSSEQLDYIKEVMGNKFYEWLIDNNAIDIDAIVDEAISGDGISHFIASYDGEEIDLGNNLFAYRVG